MKTYEQCDVLELGTVLTNDRGQPQEGISRYLFISVHGLIPYARICAIWNWTKVHSNSDVYLTKSNLLYKHYYVYEVCLKHCISQKRPADTIKKKYIYIKLKLKIWVHVWLWHWSSLEPGCLNNSDSRWTRRRTFKIQRQNECRRSSFQRRTAGVDKSS